MKVWQLYNCEVTTEDKEIPQKEDYDCIADYIQISKHNRFIDAIVLGQSERDLDPNEPTRIYVLTKYEDQFDKRELGDCLKKAKIQAEGLELNISFSQYNTADYLSGSETFQRVTQPGILLGCNAKRFVYRFRK